MCATYFDTVGKSLPIVSEKKLFDRIRKMDRQSQASLVLLLLAIKLVVQSLDPRDEPRNTLYWNTRQFCVQVEEAPLLSLLLLQSKVLIAQYEINHGIYPTGMMSVSHAARLGQMMGLHDRKHASQLFRSTPTWTGREEERRVWWAVLVLDR